MLRNNIIVNINKILINSVKNILHQLNKINDNKKYLFLKKKKNSSDSFIVN